MSQQALAAAAGLSDRDRRDGDSAQMRSGHNSQTSAADDPRLRVSSRLSVSPLISPRPMLTSHTKPYPLGPDLGPLAETFSFHTLSTRSHEPLPPLKEGATTRDRLAYIGRQLDLFGRRDLLLQKFRVLGEDERRGGGELPCPCCACCDRPYSHAACGARCTSQRLNGTSKARTLDITAERVALRLTGATPLIAWLPESRS